MSKLFKLKEWVTIPDAARHLSQIVNEPVSEADVLQMALDGHLKLTVDFPNRAKARIGRVIPYKDVPHHELPSLDGKGTFTYADGYPLHDIKNGAQLQGETPFIHFEKEVVSIDGLWDLAMLGNERIDIEFDLQNLIGGPEVTMTNIEGTFLNRSDGTVYVEAAKTADFQMTQGLRRILDEGGNDEDLMAFMEARSLTSEEHELRALASEVLQRKPEQGYLTISPALQWRLQYKRVIEKAGTVEGVYSVFKS